MLPGLFARYAILAALALLSASAHAQAPPPGPPSTQPASQAASEGSTQPDRLAEQELWARRAARAQAAEKLLTQVRTLDIAAGTTVADFLSESPRLEEALLGFLVGLEETEPARHRQGACTVTLALELDRLAAAMGRIRDQYYRNDRFGKVDFAVIVRREAPAVLRQSATASAPAGVVPPPLLGGLTGLESFDRCDQATRRYWLATVTEAGRRQAEDAARQDALARLARRAGELPVEPGVPLVKFVAAKQEDDLREFVRGARLAGLRYHGDAPVVEAETEIALPLVYAAVKAWVHVHRPEQTDQIGRLEQRIVEVEGAVGQSGVGWAELAQLKRLDPVALAAIGLYSSRPAWAGELLRCTGRAKLAPAAGAAAERAAAQAEQDARMALAVAAGKLKVTDSLSVGQLSRQQPSFRGSLLAWLQAAQAAGEAKIGPEQAEVTLELPLAGLWRIVAGEALAGIAPPQPTTHPRAPAR